MGPPEKDHKVIRIPLGIKVLFVQLTEKPIHHEASQLSCGQSLGAVPLTLVSPNLVLRHLERSMSRIQSTNGLGKPHTRASLQMTPKGVLLNAPSISREAPTT